MEKRAPKYAFFVMICVLMLAFSACGSKEEPVKVIPPIEEAEPVAATAIPQEQPITEAATPVPAVQATAIPAAPSVPTAAPLVVQKFGFGQDEQSVGYAFILQNPNPTLAIRDSEYRITAYDASEVVLDSTNNYLDLILPGQVMGIGGDLYLDEGQTVARMEVVFKDGTPELAEPSASPFTVQGVTYIKDEYFSRVAGLITSALPEDVTNLITYAVLYDAAGNIIGGGYTYLNFILANSSVGVDVYVSSAGEVAKAELYPSLNEVGEYNKPEAIPPDGQKAVVLKSGIGKGEYSSSLAFLISNPDTKYAIINSSYQVTAFAQDGRVVGVNRGYLPLLMPNALFGVGEGLYLFNEGDVAATVNVQFLHGEYVVNSQLLPFTTENVIYESDYLPKVKATVKNPYAVDLESVTVHVLAYNANDEIIGGGSGWVDFLPANGSALVEAYLSVGETPTRVELYPTLSNLDDLNP